MVGRGVLVAACGLALGCTREHVEPRAPQAGSSWSLVYVVGGEGTLERREDGSQEWVRACSERCGEYVPSRGTYRVRGALATSDPFSLPPPDLGRVVLRYDDDGHVWTHVTPRALRQPQPLMPSFVMFLR
jgi:hypothetical protein